MSFLKFTLQILCFINLLKLYSRSIVLVLCLKSQFRALTPGELFIYLYSIHLLTIFDYYFRFTLI